VAAVKHFVSLSCRGERCRVCGNAASHKMEETIFEDDPKQIRHPLAAYLCCDCFTLVVGQAAGCGVPPLLRTKPSSTDWTNLRPDGTRYR
jgi:hypothetical protein